MWQYSWVILLALVVYTWFPTSERNLLVLLQAEEDMVKLKKISNVRAIFKVEANIDDHLAREEEDMESKLKWNLVLLTSHFRSEEESLKFADNLRKFNFIKEFSVFPFTSNNIQITIFNTIFLIKGLLGDYFPSFRAKFTEDESPPEETLHDTICSEEKLQKITADVIVNILKIKDEESMEIYQSEIVGKMFPTIGTRIFTGGKPKSDYWDMIGLVKYKNRASLCRMVSSKEFNEKLPYKQKGVDDSHTYLTKQIL